MMIIFWNKDGVLLTEYLPRGTMINDLYYASIIERLHSVILEERRGKVSHGVLLLHDNASRGKRLIFFYLNQKKNQKNQKLDQSNKFLVSVAQNINLEWKSSS